MTKKHDWSGLHYIGISALIFLMGFGYHLGFEDMDCINKKNAVCDYAGTGFYLFFIVGFILFGMGIYLSFRPMNTEKKNYERT